MTGTKDYIQEILLEFAIWVYETYNMEFDTRYTPIDLLKDFLKAREK